MSTAKLYVVHGSHPCRTVELALDMKGIAYKKVELPPPSHALIMRALFGKRTVPAIKFADGEKRTGSRDILRRLDERVPEPALLPADPSARDAVLAAEAWGDETFQPIARRILWPTLAANASAAPSFGDGAKLPLPGAVLKLSMPLIARVEIALNGAKPDARAADLRALPGYLDKIDAWIADGTMGGPVANAADLQIAPTLRLLMTMEDLKRIIGPRPAGELAMRHFGPYPGHIPAGAIASELLPA